MARHHKKRRQVRHLPTIITSNQQSTRPHSYLPVQAVRKLLRSLHRGRVNNEELGNLHITVSDISSPPLAITSATTSETMTAFFQSKEYQLEMRLLDLVRFDKKPEKAKSCGAWISALLSCWTDDLARTAGRKARSLRDHRLHIATDSYTRGIRSTLTIVSNTDTLQRSRLSIIPRQYPIGKGFTNIELYALLAIALKGYHGKQTIEEITIFSTYSHWVQRITATIPSSYMRSVLEETQQLEGVVEIRLGPCVSFLEEAGQRQILQTIFECCNVEDTIPKVIVQPPSSSNDPRKRKSITDDVEKERKRQKASDIADELLIHDE
ncbi:uncharacterized protein RCO7_07685 [Rhynchosporium graminicola]|uniref:Uncharacterized protein n=1 Tax=Rhynchosporium graminicola TaxID=2792576 RepID=A0A1E1LPS3_9HELO|nr:uncharacterized protein RCO7_07685 [Rhynchosporium commune]